MAGLLLACNEDIMLYQGFKGIKLHRQFLSMSKDSWLWIWKSEDDYHPLKDEYGFNILYREFVKTGRACVAPHTNKVVVLYTQNNESTLALFDGQGNSSIISLMYLHKLCFSSFA